jgi:hypothetical protein
LPQALKTRLSACEKLFVSRERDASRGKAQKTRPYLVKVVYLGRRKLRDADAASCFDLNQAAQLQQTKRFPDRRTAGAELICELHLLQALAGHEGLTDDVLSKLLGDLLGQREETWTSFVWPGGRFAGLWALRVGSRLSRAKK